MTRTKKGTKPPEQAWGLGFGMGRRKDVFIYDLRDSTWWVDVKVVGIIVMMLAEVIRICDGKKYINLSDAVKLSSGDTAQKLLAAKARLDPLAREAIERGT